MKFKSQPMVAAGMFSLLCATMSLPAQTNYSSLNNEDSDHHSGGQSGRLNAMVKASEVMGLEVQNYQQEKLGKVSDLALDVSSGRILMVVVSAGGFMGMGNTLMSVPPGVLHYDSDKRVLHLDATKQKFTESSKFDKASLNQGSQGDGFAAAYGNYGQQPYFGANEMNNSRSMNTNMDGTMSGSTSSRMGKNKMGNESHNWGNTNNSSSMSGSSLGYIQLASKLMGMPVNNLQNEKIGELENFALDVMSGRIVAAIISSGGYLGMGGELSAVPPSALRFNSDHDALQLDVSKETLAGSPHFKSNEWPDFGAATYVGGVYQAYKVEPYFGSNSMSNVDNTRRNVRDRDHGSVTPIDQGNNQSDINITAQIRREIIAHDGMSTNAKNIKIITVDGRVTLRGPVNTAEEKSTIGDIATRIASAGSVDNQLEVQAATGAN